MPTTTPAGAIVSASIRQDQHDQLRELAEADDRSVSSLIRVAIDQFLIDQARDVPPKASA